jgi:hypothetical protein
MRRSGIVAGTVLVSVVVGSGLASAADKVKIQKTEPSTAVHLTRDGQRIPITVIVAYDVTSADVGHIGLVFQDQEHRRLATVEEATVAEVQRGRGSVTLANTLEVLPASAKQVTVYVSMVLGTPQGQGPQRVRVGTSIADQVTFKIK